MILEILAQTKRDDVVINKLTFDQFYTGNIGEMMEALFVSMTVHFKPFFSQGKLFGILTENANKVANSAEN